MPSRPLPPEDTIGPLFTDLYELTMAAAYLKYHPSAEATFTLFVRDRPERNFYVAAGLEEALRILSRLRFSASDIDYLARTGRFADDFLDYLTGFRFTCHVRAMAEGTVFFPEEPVAEVTGPAIEAQIVETLLLNCFGFQTLIASKAARIGIAAAGRPVVDFSLRRTQGYDAGLKVARSTYLAGFSATSSVSAGKQYGIPISGTMAHSFVTSFTDEAEAFAAYADVFPDDSVFLIDTYDTVKGAKNAARIGKQMKKSGRSLKGVRLDSGDMVGLSRQVRRILDQEGLSDVQVFASSGFDEHKIADVLAKGARIDAFGVGTKAGVSADAPYLDIVYKLARFGGRNVRKLSPGKQTLAGEKQVFRISDGDGRFAGDIIGEKSEIVEGTETLLETVMDDGREQGRRPGLEEIRKRAQRQITALPDACRRIEEKWTYPVRVSDRLQKIQEEVDKGGG
jgi:nicotinate phosphoribosyltransferase